jgi:hypothetical protein
MFVQGLCCCLWCVLLVVICRWEPMLGVLAVGLYPQLRNEQVTYLCHLVRVLHNTQDYLALVALLLQVGPASRSGGQKWTCCPSLLKRGASLSSRGWR